MAYHPENRWIADVLEKGINSPFFKVFDIERTVAENNGKIIVPVLGKYFRRSNDV